MDSSHKCFSSGHDFSRAESRAIFRGFNPWGRGGSRSFYLCDGLMLVRPPSGKHVSKHAVSGGVELELKSSRGTPRLLHQRGIKQECGAVHKRAGSNRPGSAAGLASRLAAGKIFVQLKVAPEFLRIRLAPHERLPERDKKFLAKEVQ